MTKERSRPRPDGTAKTPTPRFVDDIHDLVDHAELVDVALLRVSGERHPSGSEIEDNEAPSIQVLQRAEVDHIEVRCVIESSTAEGRFLADVSSRYELDEPLDIDQPVLEEFTSRVALMALYPFVREAVHQTAARLRLPAPLLGLLKADQIELTRSDEPGPSEQASKTSA